MEDPSSGGQELDCGSRSSRSSRRRTVRDKAGITYFRWISVLSRLLDPFLEYLASSIGIPVVISGDLVPIALNRVQGYPPKFLACTSIVCYSGCLLLFI